MATDKAALWAGWTRDAAGKFENPESDEPEEAAEEMVDFVTHYADVMLEEFENREEEFDDKPRAGRKPRKRRKEEE